MKKITTMLSMCLVGTVLFSFGAMAETITICYKGENITLEQKDSERFFELGARLGECPEDDRNDEKGEDNGQEGNTTAHDSEKERKQGKEKKQDNAKKQEKDQKAREDKTKSENGQGNGQAKVTICHKGKVTITVAEPSLKAHLAHGDTIGACAGSPQSVGQNLQKTTQDISSGDSQNNTANDGKKHKGKGKKSK